MTSCSSGKNASEAKVAEGPVAPAGAIAVSTIEESKTCAEIFHGENATGRLARAARKAAVLAASGGGNSAVSPALPTGKVKFNSALPGRQISLHTTHLAFALISALPSENCAGGVISTGN